ncbi:ATP-binding cassette domain-containing protein [Actinoalloteichus hymeniacidonis]|uniref:Daunorubicin resistance ABC transporter ATP-binding subunit n=1 Tax=Actinoalloteichus hymeniacidonis TaxID=340345 RepID=A0AAC9HPF2_9PSEU|nr:ATP-binding cassette domain-containing protein [Actinoalloteichus hymeniacidonis]AOS62949.1 daunorubicin resistance ABC transporter ATP-binding subunit [Actinoalloteichus hymeniacidonis]MBB5909016.1 ABC-2 type transport system ATP-binding protein [Actinoalloteichus hymeniacidonis]
MGSEPIVRAVGLTKSYGRNPVLAGVDIAVERGTVFALLGPNGAGKTTMVRILSTLLRPDDGTATVAGYDVVRQAKSVRRVISLTGQYAAVDELLSGRENLVMMARLNRFGRAAARARAAELLARFDLEDAQNRIVGRYSGGMRRRLDLAISLISNPPVIFLDEPTTGLDPRSRQTMWTVIRELVAAGTTILLTTQYLEEADQLADRIAVLNNGTIVAEGTAAELKRGLSPGAVELAFLDETDLDRAARRLGHEVLHRDETRLQLRVAFDGTAEHVRVLLERTRQAGATATTLELDTPSLDDVFLALTSDASTNPATRQEVSAR